jgi:leucyl aminopeptidase (aminopeptidase T)
MEKIYKIMIEKCANAKKDESILIITDNNKKKIAESFFNYLLKNNYNVTFKIIVNMKIDGQEPEIEISKLIENSNIIFYMTTCSLTHTRATKNALKNNVKVISMPNIEEDLIKKYIDLDYDKLTLLNDKLSEILTNGNKVKIITDLGTNLELDISNQKCKGLNGICENGKLINLPDGEVMISPIDGNGTLIIDGSMPPDQQSPWGTIGKIKTPIELDIKDGKIIKFNKCYESKVLYDTLNNFGENARIIAEFGIGTNHNAQKITGNVTIDEKILGTIHIAFGNSVNIGGNNDVPIHLDGVIKNPTVYIDGILIMKNGEIKI